MLRVVATALVFALPLHGQAPVIADSGTLVRMHTATGPVVGRLTVGLRATDDVIRFCAYPGRPCTVMAGGDPGLRMLSRREVERIEVAKGNQSRRGAVFGAVIGALIGGGAGSFGAGICDRANCPSQTTGIITGGLTVGLVFAMIGGAIGSAFPRW